MTQQMDMIRKLFLEKQLAILPADVIGIIRENTTECSETASRKRC
jgi:hypothetical protein